MPENESREWLVAEMQDMRRAATAATWAEGISDMRWAYWQGAYDGLDKALDYMRRAGLMEPE
jgi:hypothetical protein